MKPINPHITTYPTLMLFLIGVNADPSSIFRYREKNSRSNFAVNMSNISRRLLEIEWNRMESSN
jgi:hypothetical protein